MILYIAEAVLLITGLTCLSVREWRMRRRESELIKKYISEGMTEDCARFRAFLETSPFVINEGQFKPSAGAPGGHATFGEGLACLYFQKGRYEIIFFNKVALSA